jgi:16S rRNA A1518/A1519 N6-dimethyltransferase RsmA/KsgA/DIM1 with predicted DNA glycosylase/AP lyase activity
MLHNVLSRQLTSVGRARVEEALAAAGIAADRRPQDLSVDQWMALSRAIGPLDGRGSGA